MPLLVGELYSKLSIKDDGADAVLSRHKSGLQGIEGQAGKTTGALGKLSGAFSGIGKLAGGAAMAGIGAAAVGIAGLGAGILAAGGAGLKFNSDMEKVRAQLMGFVKDGGKVDTMLADLKTEAATTPFSFNEMAEAMVSLTPAAKQSGMDVMALIEQAEILAALNPAEGMVGGAFALKEALSGDFTSIIERFNLPRQRLNELKEQGVPAVEAVNTVLGEMGADISLVDNLSKTLSGRWSTVQDTLMNLAAVATKPIFDQLSAGMGQLGDYLSANEAKLTAFAEMIGGKLVAGLGMLRFALDNVIDGFQFTADDGPSNFFESVGLALQQLVGFITGAVIPALDTFLAYFNNRFEDAGDAGFFAQLGFHARGLANIFIEQVIPAIQQFFGFLQAHQETLTTLAAVIGVAVGVFGPLAAIVTTVAGAIGGLTAAFAGSTTVIGAVVALLGGPVTIAVAAVALAIGLLAVAWAKNWGDIQGKTAAVWGAIQGIVSGGMNLIVGIVRALTSLMQGDWAGAWAGMAQAASGGRALIVGIVSSLKGAIFGIFAGAGAWLIQSGRDIVMGLVSGIASSIGSAIAAARNVAASVISTVQSFGHSPWPSMVVSGRDVVMGLVVGMDDAQQEAAKKAAEVASSIIDALAKALDFSQKAAGIDLSNVQDKLMGTVSQLKFLAEHAAQSLGDTGRFIGTELLDAAKAAGEAMESVFGALGAGLEFAQDAVAALNGENDILDDRLRTLISALKFLGEHATKSLADTGRFLGTEMLDTAKATGEAFNAVFDALGKALSFAIDAAEAVNGDTDILDDRILNLTRGLVGIGSNAVKALGAAGEKFSKEVLAEAQLLGEGMLKPLEAVSAALGFTIEAAEAVNSETDILDDRVLNLTNGLVGIAINATEAMAAAAQRFDTEVLAASSAAAEALGKPFGVLTDALGFTSDVIDFLADNKWPDVSTQLINLLTDLAVRSTQAFAEAAGKFTTDVLESAKAFADAAGPVFDTIKKVADGFTALEEMGKVSESKLGLFEGNIERVMRLVKKMRGMAEQGISDATVFRNLMDQIAAALKVGTETLGGAQAKVSVASAGGTTKIPALARGGVVTRPTIAQLGEGGETEIASPESLMRRIVREESGQLAWQPGMGSGSAQQEMHIHVRFEVGGRAFKEEVFRVVGRELMFQGAH